MLRQAVAIPVEPTEVVHCLHNSRPGVASELGRRDEQDVAPDLEHELAVQVLPDVDVLPVVDVRPQEGIFTRAAQVVRHRAAPFPLREGSATSHGDDLWVVDVDSRREIPEDADVQVGPQQKERPRRVEVDVQRVVAGVVVALKDGEMTERLSRPAIDRLAGTPET